MQEITIYHKSDGSIYQITTEDQAPYYDDDTYGWVLGKYSNTTHQVVDGAVVERVKTLAALKVEKLQELASCRFFVETGGIMIGDVLVRTDRESQAQLSSAVTSLREGYVQTVPWKGGNGVWVQVGLEEITPVAQAVSVHVQNCFSREKELADLVELAASAEDVNSIVWRMI